MSTINPDALNRTMSVEPTANTFHMRRNRYKKTEINPRIESIVEERDPETRLILVEELRLTLDEANKNGYFWSSRKRNWGEAWPKVAKKLRRIVGEARDEINTAQTNQMKVFATATKDMLKTVSENPDSENVAAVANMGIVTQAGLFADEGKLQALAKVQVKISDDRKEMKKSDNRKETKISKDDRDVKIAIGVPSSSPNLNTRRDNAVVGREGPTPPPPSPSKRDTPVAGSDGPHPPPPSPLKRDIESADTGPQPYKKQKICCSECSALQEKVHEGEVSIRRLEQQVADDRMEKSRLRRSLEEKVREGNVSTHRFQKNIRNLNQKVAEGQSERERIQRAIANLQRGLAASRTETERVNKQYRILFNSLSHK